MSNTEENEANTQADIAAEENEGEKTQADAEENQDEEKKVVKPQAVLDAEELAKCQEELAQLQRDLTDLRIVDEADCSAFETTNPHAAYKPNRVCKAIKAEGANVKTVLPSKVAACSWWPNDNEYLSIVLQDGLIVTHNVKAGTQSLRHFLQHHAKLKACDYSPDGTKLAVGGLDNVVTVHEMPDFNQPGYDGVPTCKPWKTLEKHIGYIETIKWLGNDKILSGGGDKTILLWDLNNTAGTIKEEEMKFEGHEKDVIGLETWEGDPNLFLSGSADTLARLWDIRVQASDHNGCVATFVGHEFGVSQIAAINDVKAFVTASEDSYVRMFDLRSRKCLQMYGRAPYYTASDWYQGADEETYGCTAMCVSKSGRTIFVGRSKGQIQAYDTLNASKPIWTEDKHHCGPEGGDVSCLELNRDGDCLASGALSTGISNNIGFWSL